MYKTIRHGENSLQYTILPQNDDFRIEGKLTSAEGSSNNTGGSSSSGGGGSANGGTSKSRSSSGGGKAAKGATRRRSFFAYLGLIFVCTVIVGAVLIPFLVSAECLPSPTEWFLKTKAALINSSTNSGNGVAVHKAAETSAPTNVGIAGVDIGKTVRIINQNGIEKFILKVNKTTKTEAATFKQNATLNIGSGNAAVPQRPPMSPSLLPIQNEQQPLNLPQHQISEVRFETVDQTPKSQAIGNNRQSRLWPIMPTPQVLIVTTLRIENNRSVGQPTNTTTRTTPPFNTNMNTNIKQIMQSSSSLDSVNALNAPRVPAYANQSVMNQSSPNGIAPPTITTRIIQVPLLKSAAKKPIIPPILAKANSQSTTVVGMNVGSPPAVPALQTPQAAAAAAAAAESINGGFVGGVAQNHEIMNNNGLGGKRSDWMNAHWPYINPSTYFQDWTGHKAKDSVLLPALLGFALIGMILIITVCLVARNKRTIVSSVRKRNRNDIEEQGAEDNATLLTTTNMSDDD